jgi:hypothetical protein
MIGCRRQEGIVNEKDVVCALREFGEGNERIDQGTHLQHILHQIGRGGVLAATVEAGGVREALSNECAGNIVNDCSGGDVEECSLTSRCCKKAHGGMMG